MCARWGGGGLWGYSVLIFVVSFESPLSNRVCVGACGGLMGYRVKGLFVFQFQTHIFIF